MSCSNGGRLYFWYEAVFPLLSNSAMRTSYSTATEWVQTVARQWNMHTLMNIMSLEKNSLQINQSIIHPSYSQL